MAFDFATAVENILTKEQKHEHLLDRDWVRQSFMVTGKDINDGWKRYRYYSGADRQYTDSSLGGSLACNPPTQFTRYADTRRKGRLYGSRDDVSIYNKSPNVGMGQYYFEAIHDNSQVLFLEFGVPKFQSLFSYLATAVDQPMSEMANHVSGSSWYNIGKAAGVFVGVYYIGWMWTVAAITVNTIKYGYEMVFGAQVAKYYSLKHGMHVYWTAVNNMVTTTAAELGLSKPAIGEPVAGKIGAPLVMSAEEVANTNIFFKDFMSTNGYIDIRRIVGRAQAILNTELTKSREMDIKKDISYSDWDKYVNEDVKVPKEQSMGDFVGTVLSGSELYQTTKKGKQDSEPGKVEVEEDASLIDDKGGFSTAIYNKIAAQEKDTIRYIESAMKGGSRYAIFNVEPLGDNPVTFSNETGEIPTKDGLNAIGGLTQNIEFSTAGANVVGVGIGQAVSGALDVMQGAASSLTFGASNVLLALLGGGYVEMPLMWKNSNMTAQEYTFKMDLTTVYNHPMARLHKQLIPMFMVMAGALPLATGKASHTSPFLCSAFLRGIVNIDMGMITKLTITSNVGDTGVDSTGHSLGYTVEFTITDFTTILSAPISSMANGSVVNAQDDTSAISRFMQTVGSRDLFTTKYVSKRAKLRLTSAIAGIDIATDPAYIGTLVGDFVYPLSGTFLDDVNFVELDGH